MTNFPNGVSSLGVPLMPNLPLTTGTFYFVHSGTGSDGNSGRDKAHPLATVDAALGKCASNKGDVVVLMQGHAETVTATNMVLDVAGVTIVGLGRGLQRPTFTYGAAAATITVSAANVRWSNCHHIANFLSVAAAFTIGAAKDFQVDHCSFVDNSNVLDFLSVVVTGATDNDADGLRVEDNYQLSLPATDGATVSILAAEIRVRIERNHVDKAATNNAGHLITLAAKIVLSFRVLDNLLVCLATSQAVGILLTGSGTTSTGIVARNLVMSQDTTTALLATAGTGLYYLENYQTGAKDKQGTIFPAVYS